MASFFGRQRYARKFPMRIPVISGERYYFCFQHWGQVLYSLNITGRRNMERVWKYLLEEGDFVTRDVASDLHPFSLRVFYYSAGGEIRHLHKRYIACEPETLKAAFERLAQRF